MPGQPEPALRQMYGAGLPDNVELLGPLSSADVDRELSAADVFLLAVLEEGVPSVFAGGDGRRPHVCGDTGGVWWRGAGTAKTDVGAPHGCAGPCDGLGRHLSGAVTPSSIGRGGQGGCAGMGIPGETMVTGQWQLTRCSCPDRSRPQERSHQRYPPRQATI